MSDPQRQRTSRAGVSRRSLLTGFVAMGTAALADPAVARSRRPFFGPGGQALGLQIYTLGDAAQRDIDGAFRSIRAIGYTEVELIAGGPNAAAAVRAALDRTGLAARSMQAGFRGVPGFGTGLDRLIADATLLRLEYLAASAPELPVGRYGGPRPGEAIPDFQQRLFASMTADDWTRYADRLNAIGARLKPHGLTMVHHNHNVDFLPVGDTTAYDIVQRHTDPALVAFELDVGWVKAAGLDPVAILTRYPGRFRLMHVKDVLPTTKPNFAMRQDPAIVGRGLLDWPTLLAAARTAGIVGYYVEQEPPFTMPRLDAARANYRYLAALRV